MRFCGKRQANIWLKNFLKAVSIVDCLFCWEGKADKDLLQVSVSEFLTEENLGKMQNKRCSKALCCSFWHTGNI